MNICFIWRRSNRNHRVCPIKGALGDDVLKALTEVLASYLSSRLLILLHQAQGRQPEVMTDLWEDDAFLRPGWKWLPPTQADDSPRAPSTDYTEKWYSAFYKCHHVSEVCTHHTQIFWFHSVTKGFPGGTVIKDPPAKQKTWVQSLGWEEHLEKEMANRLSFLAWKIPWTEEPGLQSTGLQRVGHDWAIKRMLYMRWGKVPGKYHFLFM